MLCVLCFLGSFFFISLPPSGGHVAGSVQKVTMCGAPLDVLCDLLPVFDPVEQLVCLDIKDPQEVYIYVVGYQLWAAITVCISATCDQTSPAP